MLVSEIMSIITAIGVLGTLMLGFLNLRSLRKREQYVQQYMLSTADYEKRRDFILSNVSEYIQALDARSLSYMALTDDEYDGKDLEIREKSYYIETLYYKIKLMINSDNPKCEEFLKLLDESLLLVKNLVSNNTMAELISYSLRTPERALDVSGRALKFMHEETGESGTTNVVTGFENNKQEKLDFIKDMIKNKDEHLKKYLIDAEQLSIKKDLLVDIIRKYLVEEKTIALYNVKIN